MIAAGEADIGLAPFTMIERRAKVIDYLILGGIDGNIGKGYFYIKNPRNKYDWTVFFQPFWKDAWIGLIVFSFVTPLLIAMIMYFRKLFSLLSILFQKAF